MLSQPENKLLSNRQVYTVANTRPVLDTLERIAIFGTDASTDLSDYHSVVVHLLNGTEPSEVDVRQFRERPPTLQYRVSLGNETFAISLRKNTNMISSRCIIRHVNGSGHSTVSPCVEHDVTCYYTGTTSDHNDSWVAASVCEGLKGLLSFGNTSLFIYPMKRTSDQTSTSTLPNHVIYRYQGDKHVCKTEDDVTEILHPTSQAQGRHQINGMKTRYIEAGIVVDPPMARFHNENILQYLFTGFNIASQLFADRSIGTLMKLLLSEIIVFNSPDGFDVSDTVDAEKTKNSFCEWQSKHHTLNKTDVTILLTRNDIEYGANDNGKSTNGLAFLSGACKIRKKCAVVEDTGPVFGLTLAHEIGHLIGMSHDNTSNNHCPPALMSAYGNSGVDAFRWSNCSAKELYNNRYNLGCLENAPVSGDELVPLPLPGMVYTADDQCRLMLGDHAYFFYNPGHDPCKAIACHTDLGNYYYPQPLMDGTDCNNTRTWCMRGQSVAMNASLQTDPIPGGWSPWVSTTCSRTCGGGIFMQTRTCTDPKPRYGGKDCEGPRKTYLLCNMQKCPDYKSLNTTCDALDKGKYGCNFTCFYRVNDLQTCFTPDLTPYRACVRQQCQQFGCDGVMGSEIKYDVCGECGGNATTCRKETYAFLNPTRYFLNGYRAVARIPIHSTAVRVEQNNTDMVLGITANNEVIFDGENCPTQTLVIIRDLRILYTRLPEIIEIAGPVNDNLVIQARVRIGSLSNETSHFAVACAYHMGRRDDIPRYTWGARTSPCSITCGGLSSSKKTYQCFDISGTTVEDYRCDIATKPNDELSRCDTAPCPVRWVASGWGYCSARCGQGFKLQNVYCMQLADGQDQVLSDDRCLGFTKPDSNITCHLEPCGIWRKMRVSQCSKSCSEGMQITEYQCFQSATSDIRVADFMCPERPKLIEVCNHGPCLIDPVGCSDLLPDCKQTYGHDICYGTYKQWAEVNCKDTCGVCADRAPPTTTAPDLDERCGQYLQGGQALELCVTKYRIWGERNCPTTCEPCIGAVDRPRDVTVRCEMYNRKYCLDPAYRQFMSANCGRYCCHCYIDGNLCRF
ncbi:A disintegrin and metalloproteinase with thrombospondin motifs 20-like isoform X2 [Dreissena polymorpha]|uniref:A disintegrin and metalloproteinase with thrombospondin motifs 20-like isoform X2 n=1 Tax=Dreissena polymorpha TaxID=45954 RepID=UPI0022656743|nr:A disintegrin and metalloproteinase with thrombospondin motifs 20-like isoform X2 [Dreissena polymorpha]